jgi:hypothetical protein
MAERDRIEAARRLPEDVARELARAGFFRIFLPEAMFSSTKAPSTAGANANPAFFPVHGKSPLLDASASPAGSGVLPQPPGRRVGRG